MTNKRTCDCGWQGHFDDLLSAVSPFDSDEMIYACPECKAIDKTHVACDEPIFDASGYPSADTLETIEKWPVKSRKECHELLTFVDDQHALQAISAPALVKLKTLCKMAFYYTGEHSYSRLAWTHWLGFVDTLILAPAVIPELDAAAAYARWQGTGEEFSHETSLWYQDIDTNIEAARSAATEAGVEILETKGR